MYFKCKDCTGFKGCTTFSDDLICEDFRTSDKSKHDLESKLKVGTRIKLGEEYCKDKNMEVCIIELVEGVFEYENGLYTSEQRCPAIWNNDDKDYDSIYHLFENDLSGFLDCEIVQERKD